MMPRGRQTSVTIRLTPEERRTLTAWQRSPTLSAGRARRGRMILQLADGIPIVHIAKTVRVSRRFIYKWAGRFLHHRVDGVADRPGRGCGDAATDRNGAAQRKVGALPLSHHLT